MTEADPSPEASTDRGFRRGLPVRLVAAGARLGVTAILVALALYLVRDRWYPGFHFGIDGGRQGLGLVAMVDLVLGPLLTAVVFNPFKARRLIALDLVVLAFVQLAAFALGLGVVHRQRPASINFHDGVFYSMPAASLRSQPDALASLATGRRTLVYVAPPATDDERHRAAARRQAGLLAHEDPMFFRPFAPHWPEVEASALRPEHSKDAALRRELPGFLDQHGGQAGDWRFFRYQGGYGSCIIAFTAAGVPVDAIACEAA